MKPARSAGILLYRTVGGILEILLAHPGGPFWSHKDLGAWQMPKGLIEPGEDEEAAAKREQFEEIGIDIAVPLIALGEIRQTGGKTVIAFAVESDFDPTSLVSNLIEIDWPPRTGRKLTIPEVDAARWFNLDEARRHILPSQAPLLDRLQMTLGSLR